MPLQGFAKVRVESAESAGLGIPLSLAVQLLFFVPQLQLQPDGAEEWLQLIEEVLFCNANVPIKKEQQLPLH